MNKIALRIILGSIGTMIIIVAAADYVVTSKRHKVTPGLQSKVLEDIREHLCLLKSRCGSFPERVTTNDIPLCRECENDSKCDEASKIIRATGLATIWKGQLTYTHDAKSAQFSAPGINGSPNLNVTITCP